MSEPAQKEKSDQTSKHWRLFKEVLAATLATPAALSVLAKMDKRLDFSQILERIVLGYDTFIIAVWSSISGILNFDLVPFRNWLTLLTILVLPAFFKLIPTMHRIETSKEDNNTKIEPVFLIFSLVFSLAFLYIFEILEDFLLLVVCASFFIPVLTKLDESWGVGRRGVFAALALFVCAAIYPDFQSKYGIPFWSIPLSAFLVYFFGWVLLLTSFFSSRLISYIGLWVTGIFVVNFIATVARPWVEGYLDSIGV